MKTRRDSLASPSAQARSRPLSTVMWTAWNTKRRACPSKATMPLARNRSAPRSVTSRCSHGMKRLRSSGRAKLIETLVTPWLWRAASAARKTCDRGPAGAAPRPPPNDGTRSRLMSNAPRSSRHSSAISPCTERRSSAVGLSCWTARSASNSMAASARSALFSSTRSACASCTPASGRSRNWFGKCRASATQITLSSRVCWRSRSSK